MVPWDQVRTILDRISQRQSVEAYRQEHWHGTFEEYLDIVQGDPSVTRSAYQRLYDMILSYGTYAVEGSGKEGLIRYHFFDDPDHDGRDAIFGLTKPLMEIVNVFKSAALKYGSERRVLLMHGPVGSSKSTIARQLKRGLERYSHTRRGSHLLLRLEATGRDRTPVPDARGSAASRPGRKPGRNLRRSQRGSRSGEGQRIRGRD